MSVLRGDARALPLREGCVSCVVTSPPYFGLRSYPDARQMGREATPDAYVAALVAVFREVWRVLREDGTVFLNLGDTHHQKQLLGIPWRVAFALQADGWYLRSDIIWAKPNPMPESVTDRPTKAHEYVFLLTKAERYVYDAAAIAERAIGEGDFGLLRTRAGVGEQDGVSWHAPSIATRQARGINSRTAGSLTRNKRSVWTVSSQPYDGAHFATMPEALVEPCILAGCPLGGIVLDPFCGTGTVGAVAERLSRRWVGIDLTYQALAQERTRQRGLRFTEAR